MWCVVSALDANTSNAGGLYDKSIAIVMNMMKHSDTFPYIVVFAHKYKSACIANNYIPDVQFSIDFIVLLRL